MVLSAAGSGGYSAAAAVTQIPPEGSLKPLVLSPSHCRGLPSEGKHAVCHAKHN